MSSSTHYQLIVDASGSMSGSETATVGSMNEQIAMVRRLATEHPDEQFLLGIVDFSSDIRVLREMAPIQNLREVSHREYVTRDCTALYDAVGTTVTRLDNLRESRNNNDNDSFVIVVITDGHENASQHFNFTAIKSLLRNLEQSGKWQFRFIGADFLTDDFTQKLGLEHAKAHIVNKMSMGDVNRYMADEMEKIVANKKGTF